MSLRSHAKLLIIKSVIAFGTYLVLTAPPIASMPPHLGPPEGGLLKFCGRAVPGVLIILLGGVLLRLYSRRLKRNLQNLAPEQVGVSSTSQKLIITFLSFISALLSMPLILFGVMMIMAAPSNLYGGRWSAVCEWIIRGCVVARIGMFLRKNHL